MEIEINKIPIYYINLLEHTSRKLDFLQKMDAAGFDLNKIKRIEAIKKEGIKNDPVYVGCFYSQLEALKEALNGTFPFMILEDDCEINKIPVNLKVPKSADAIYVGISAWGFNTQSPGNLAILNGLYVEPKNSEFVKITNMLSSHAILYLNQNYVESLIESLESNILGNEIYSQSGSILKYFGGNFLPCDVIMANQQSKGEVYALRNPIFYQGGKHQYCTLFQI